MEYTARTQEELSTLAEERDCHLYVGSSNYLLLDIDEFVEGDHYEAFAHWYLKHKPTLALLNEKFGVARYTYWRSRGGHLHVSIMLNTELLALEQIAVQAALGSDPLREIIAIHEARQGCGCNSLFKPKEAQEHEVQSDGSPEGDFGSAF